MKYLLIDGNNLGVRTAFANNELTNAEGIPTGLHFGVFQSILSLKKKFPSNQFFIVWDGKSKRRVIEAQDGVNRKIIPEGYKENRKKEETPKPLLDFYAQLPYLKKGIEQTGIPQIRLENYEADDVIASYCHYLRNSNEIVCVTSDSDYSQVLHENVSLYDGMKDKFTTKSEWEKENGITVEQYLDVSALCGDNSDNIFGVYGIGEKTAVKIIQEFGTWEKAIEGYKKQLLPYREKFPDLNDTEFERLKNLKTEKGKPKYPEITSNMPFTGVAMAIEDKKIKEKIAKSTLSAVMFEERVKLAYSLKKMDIIPDLPEIKRGQQNKDKLMEYFDYYDIESLKNDMDWFL